MAPIAVAQEPVSVPDIAGLKLAATPTEPAASTKESKDKLQWFSETGKPAEEYPYKHLLPDRTSTVHYEPLEEFTHVDPGLAALNDPTPRSFLEGGAVDDLSPEFGSEVQGIQLSRLDDRGRQQLARYVAERGVVAFRDQDFIDQDPEWQIRNWGAFFGRNHIHPTSGQPKGFPELHLVFREWGNEENTEYRFANRVSTVGWHSDVTYEKQPPGLTALFLYDSPVTGGDTAFVSQRLAYERLSPSFREYLETLKVVHSGFEQANYSRERAEKLGKGATYTTVRRDPVKNEHPLVRRHPVTGAKSIFVNRGFCRNIVGLRHEESTSILNFLYDVIEKSADIQVRVRWRPRTVVLWDSE